MTILFLILWCDIGYDDAMDLMRQKYLQWFRLISVRHSSDYYKQLHKFRQVNALKYPQHLLKDRVALHAFKYVNGFCSLQ